MFVGVFLGLAIGMSAVGVSTVVPSRQLEGVAGVVRHAAFDDRGKVSASRRQTRLEVLLDDGRLVRADSYLTNLPIPGQRVILSVRRNWIGYDSYHWDFAGK
jgi:hypothetical protein